MKVGIQTGRLVSNKWSVVTICVQPSQGRLTTYVDGRLSSISVDLLPSELRLHHRIVVGGSKQASVCAGDVRRIVIHNTSLQEEHVKQLHPLHSRRQEPRDRRALGQGSGTDSRIAGPQEASSGFRVMKVWVRRESHTPKKQDNSIIVVCMYGIDAPDSFPV